MSDERYKARQSKIKEKVYLKSRRPKKQLNLQITQTKTQEEVQQEKATSA